MITLHCFELAVLVDFYIFVLLRLSLFFFSSSIPNRDLAPSVFIHSLLLSHPFYFRVFRNGENKVARNCNITNDKEEIEGKRENCRSHFRKEAGKEGCEKCLFILQYTDHGSQHALNGT